MTTIQALEAVRNFCDTHKRWLRGAMKNQLESDELKEALRMLRQGGLDELESIIDFVDEMISRMKKGEDKHDD